MTANKIHLTNSNCKINETIRFGDLSGQRLLQSQPVKLKIFSKL